MKKINIKIITIINILIIVAFAVNAQGIRKHYTEFTDAERIAYRNIIYLLESDGTIDYLANLHARPGGLNIDCNSRGDDNCGDESYIHNDEDFLPWHRCFLLLMEWEIQNYDGKLTIPYWDWTGQSDPQGVNSRSSNGPLWANNQISSLSWSGNFLESYNVDFNLAREFGGVNLPDQALLNDVMSVTFFQNTTTLPGFRTLLEVTLHNPPHTWVGDNTLPPLGPQSGSMSDGFRSPRDPVFYFHHAMVDKIWQDWTEAGGNTVFDENDDLMPSFNGTMLPYVNPNNITDSREIGIFYSDPINQVVTLSNYSVQNYALPVEKFVYRYDIVVQNFTVPNGNSAEFISPQQIVIERDFVVEVGATFEVKNQ